MVPKRTTCLIDDENCVKTIIQCTGYCNAHHLRYKKYGDPFGGRAFHGEAERFLEQALQIETDDCIIWPFCLMDKGYGVITLDGRPQKAHRVVTERTYGPPPGTKYDAAHSPGICHERSCINPRHLRWATRKENLADKKIDGTENWGTANPRNKLTPEQVLSIFGDQRHVREIAEDLGIHTATVYAIRRGVTWSWLTGAGA